MALSIPLSLVVLGPFIIFAQFYKSLLRAEASSSYRVIPIYISPTLTAGNELRTAVDARDGATDGLMGLFIFVGSPPRVGYRLFVRRPTSRSSRSSYREARSLLGGLRGCTGKFAAPVCDVVGCTVVLSRCLWDIGVVLTVFWFAFIALLRILHFLFAVRLGAYDLV